MAAKPRARRPRSDEVGRNSGNESSDVDDDEEESGKSGETPIPAELKEERSPPSPDDAGVQRSGEVSPARGGVALKTKTTTSNRAKKHPPASQEEDDASPARGGPLPDDRAYAGHSDKRAATPKRGEKRSPLPLQEDERPEKRAARTDVETVAASAPKRKKKKKKSKRSAEKDTCKKKKLGGNGGNEGSDDDAEESGKSGEDAIPSPLKRAEQRSPPSPDDDSPDAGHDNKRAATPKRGEKRSPPLLHEEERPEKRAAAGPDADTVAASAPKRKKNRRKKKKKKALAKPTSPPPQEQNEHHGREMAEQEPTNTSPPQDEHRAREEEQQEKKKIAEPSNTSPPHDKGMHSAHGEKQLEEEVANQEHADNTSLAHSSPRLNLQSDPEPMGFWGVEVKPGEPYTIYSVQGCLRITQATLGNLESVGWNTIACSVGGKKPVGFCALNSTLVMYRLDLECGEGQNVVFSVIGDSSIHLAGYYKISDAAANVQALVTQIQEADDRDQITHVHGAQEHNDLADTEVHNDGINLMVGQAGLNASPNVQALVTQSQEAADHEIPHAHDIAQGCNALETEVHIDCTNQIVGQSGLNNMIFDGASLGSGHHRVDKNDVGGTINELKIVELKSGDCNAEIASDGKEVEVEYIGKLMDGTVFDSFEGRPTIHTFTLGVDKMIAGWHQGIKGMRVGGRRILTIPPALAYKDKAQKQIPANSWLVYDIELLSVSEPVK